MTKKVEAVIDMPIAAFMWLTLRFAAAYDGNIRLLSKHRSTHPCMIETVS